MISRTQEQQEKAFSWGKKRTERRIIGDREGDDAEGGWRRKRVREWGWGDPKRAIEGKKVGCKRVVTASQLERV